MSQMPPILSGQLKRLRGFFVLSLSLMSLSCTTFPSASPTVEGDTFELKSFLNGSIASYILNTQERFSIKAVETEHQNAVDTSVTAFETDLKNGTMDRYYANPSFSILLAAGSEGSAFNTSEGIEQVTQAGAVFAQAVVFNGEILAPDIYQGQFSNGRFYFSKQPEQVILPDNITYLITLDLNLETTVFKGQLSAGSEGSSLAAGSEGSALTIAIDEVLLKEKSHLYQKSLDLHQEKSEVYSQDVGELKFVVQKLFPAAYTETFARLARAYPEEFLLGMQMLYGLPKGILEDEVSKHVERMRARWEADCGFPVPDEGKLYPQIGGPEVVIPVGYQTAALERVIADIPELKAALESKQDLPPPRFPNDSFGEFLSEFQAKYPEVFEKHQFSDELKPPTCVQPRQLKGGVALNHPGKRPPPGPKPPPEP